MPIFAASSGIVIPGWPCTKARASAARVPLPFRRPALRAGGRPGLRVALRAGLRVVLRVGLRVALGTVLRVAFDAAFFAAGAFRVRPADPRGRPGPRRAGLAVVAAADADPPTPASADAAASRRANSSARGFNSFSRSVISRRLSSRKSVTVSPLHSCRCGLESHIAYVVHLTLVVYAAV